MNVDPKMNLATALIRLHLSEITKIVYSVRAEKRTEVSNATLVYGLEKLKLDWVYSDYCHKAELTFEYYNNHAPRADQCILFTLQLDVLDHQTMCEYDRCKMEIVFTEQLHEAKVIFQERIRK